MERWRREKARLGLGAGKASRRRRGLGSPPLSMGKIADSTARKWRKLDPPAAVGVSGGGVGGNEVRRRRKKKKGRLPAQPAQPSQPSVPARGRPDPTPELEMRRSLRPLRRRQYYCEYYEEFDDDELEELPPARDRNGEEEEDEPEARRKEKKLNLVLKKAASPAPPPPPPAPALDSSDGEEKERHPLKKRRICGNAGDGGVRPIGSGDVKERMEGRIHRQAGVVSVPGSPSSDLRLAAPLPDRKALELILDKLQKKDTYDVFAEPVDPEELPDYHDIIENPMDFTTVRQKLSSGNYSTLEQLESDVFLICSNAMQYNAPETIYFKQARAIQELARKKFDKFKADEIKSVQKTRSASITEKPVKKHLVSVQEHVVSDFSSGATVAAPKDACASSNVSQDGGVEKLVNGNIIAPCADGNCVATEKQMDKLEDAVAKDSPLKFGKKSSVLEENRRATYQCSQPVVQMDSIFSTFESETKQLIAVGFHTEHSYARSLARFAAILGPTAWAVASKKIEQALPAGCKFGRGWVGEYEPLPTPVLTFEKIQSQLTFNGVPREKTGLKKSRLVSTAKVVENGGNKNLHLHLGNLNDNTESARQKVSNGRDEGNVKQATLEGRPVLFGSSAVHQQHKTIGIIESTRSETMLRPNGSSCTSSMNMNSNQVALQRFDHNSEKESSGLLDVFSRNRNAASSTHSKPPEGGIKGAHFPYQAGSCNQGLVPNGNSMSSSDAKASQLSQDAIYKQFNGYPSFVVQNYGHHNVDDPVELMRRLSGKTSSQPQLNQDNAVNGVENRIMASAPFIKQENSSASAAAARAWMSIGPTSTSGPSRENFPPVSVRPETKTFAVPLAPQAVYANGKLAQHGGGRLMGFSQNMDANSPKFQINPHWQGLPNAQKGQKKDMLPPDLNIGFQAPASPARQPSGICIDSQQPDLALQL